MPFDLYLAVVDSTGAPVPGLGVPDRLTNPFRGNVAVTAPFLVSGYEFGADVPAATGGGAGTGKVDLQELVVDMFVDDSASNVLFRATCTGRRFRSIDLLLVTSGEARPTVVGGVGVASAVLSGISWRGTESFLTRRLTVDGQIFSVGSATQRPDGSYNPFQFSSYNTSTGTVT